MLSLWCLNQINNLDKFFKVEDGPNKCEQNKRKKHKEKNKKKDEQQKKNLKRKCFAEGDVTLLKNLGTFSDLMFPFQN